jgi:polygalacturonase
MQFLDFRDCSQVELRDVLVLGSYGWTIVPWNCRDVRLTNVKIFSWRDNDDGLDICSSQNVTVDRCFFRTKDDCIAIKAPRKEYFPAKSPDPSSSAKPDRNFDVENVVVQRSVIWNAEWGNALEIGFELLTPHVRNIAFRDCDIIRVETGAVFSIHNGDSAAVEDVRFEKIRVEDARDKLVDLRVGLSIYSQDCPERYHRRNPQRKPTGAGQWVPWEKLTAEEQAVARQNRGAIRNVRLADIQLLEKIPPRSFIVNAGGELSGVSFQNLQQADRVLTTSEDLGLSIDGATQVSFAR